MRIAELNEQVSRRWLNQSSPGKIPATDENLQKAKDFILEKWRERAAERGNQMPSDLSYSCKFTTLFVKMVFGGSIKGNFDHQFNFIDGRIVDLNHDAADVVSLDDPHRHDELFFGNRDHIGSMKSCLPRVEQWVEEFIKVVDHENT